MLSTASSFVACMLVYEYAVRQIAVLRLLTGMKPVKRRPADVESPLAVTERWGYPAEKRSADVDTAIKIISAGSNCYLVKTGSGFVLIDTGIASKRLAVETEIEDAGCGVGDLKLIVLTHGDSDHADNAAYLRNRYGAPIAMHPADAAMVELGDMSLGRKVKPDRVSGMGRVIKMVGRLMRLVNRGSFDRFSPDISLEDRQSLSFYGFDATVVHLPAHSKGSIGISTGGELFCGDFIYNFFGPNQVWVDDLAAANAGVERLKALNVRTVYPGHGKPFAWEKFARKHASPRVV